MAAPTPCRFAFLVARLFFVPLLSLRCGQGGRCFNTIPSRLAEAVRRGSYLSFHGHDVRACLTLGDFHEARIPHFERPPLLIHVLVPVVVPVLHAAQAMAQELCANVLRDAESS